MHAQASKEKLNAIKQKQLKINSNAKLFVKKRELVANIIVIQFVVNSEIHPTPKTTNVS